MNNVDPRIIEQFDKRSPFKLSEGKLLCLVMIGSHSHGTHIPNTDPNSIDDVDYMGIVMPPVDELLGIKQLLGKQWKTTVFQHEELDVVFYSFQHFMSLLYKSNPNVLGLLWMKEYIVKVPEFDLLIEHRDLFSTKKAFAAFRGVVMEHFDRMTVMPPTRKEVWKYNFTKLLHYLLHPTEPVPEAPWAKKGKKFMGYMGAKRKALVEKHGYDIKDAAHTIRLSRMATEFLNTGEFNVFREHDADFLKDVKRGKYPLDYILGLRKKVLDDMDKAAKKSGLPKDPDFEAINNLATAIMLGTAISFLDN